MRIELDENGNQTIVACKYNKLGPNILGQIRIAAQTKPIVICGLSCSGKETFGKILEKELGLEKNVSFTTREKREGEQDGVDYWFVDHHIMKTIWHSFRATRIDRDNFYGMPQGEIGQYMIMDDQGINSYGSDDVFIIRLNVPFNMRLNRLGLRDGKDETWLRERDEVDLGIGALEVDMDLDERYHKMNKRNKAQRRRFKR